MIVTGAVGLSASFAWLSTLTASDGYAERGLRADAAQRPLGRADLHADHLDRPRRRRAGARGRGVGLLQTFQQLGGAVGLAVIVSVYAAGSEPGAFLPGAQAAFLTSATMAALAGVAGLVALANRRRRPDGLEKDAVEEALAA